MRLYGSLHNRLMEGPSPCAPEIGMGATRLMHTDRLAMTIVSVDKSGKRIEVTRDSAKRKDNNGMSETQIWEFASNPEGSRRAYTLRKDGSWVTEGLSMREGERLLVGERLEYYDFSF